MRLWLWFKIIWKFAVFCCILLKWWKIEVKANGVRSYFICHPAVLATDVIIFIVQNCCVNRALMFKLHIKNQWDTNLNHCAMFFERNTLIVIMYVSVNSVHFVSTAILHFVSIRLHAVAKVCYCFYDCIPMDCSMATN